MPTLHILLKLILISPSQSKFDRPRSRLSFPARRGRFRRGHPRRRDPIRYLDRRRARREDGRFRPLRRDRDVLRSRNFRLGGSEPKTTMEMDSMDPDHPRRVLFTSCADDARDEGDGDLEEKGQGVEAQGRQG